MHTDGTHIHPRSRQGSLLSRSKSSSSRQPQGQQQLSQDSPTSTDSDPTAPFSLSKPAHLLSASQVVQELTTDPDNGLTQDQVSFRLKQVGLNELVGDGGVSVFRIFMGQLFNAMSLVLIMGMVASFAIKSWIEASVVTAVVVVNIVVGFFQEYSAEKTMDSLRSLSSPTAQVIRDGNIVTVRSADIAPGDVVEVKTGDTIPADMRIFECMNFEVDEALLTGESLPIAKSSSAVYDSNGADVGVGDRLNMAYASSTVTKGRAKGVVVYTGMTTEIGKIALSLHASGKRTRPVPKTTTTSVTPNTSSDETKVEVVTIAHRLQYYLLVVYEGFKYHVGQFLGVSVGTPLQRKLSWLAILLFGIAVVFAIICLAANGFRNEQAVILYAVGTGLSMIPASLVVVLTITMAVGTKIMVSRNVIVRKLDSLEALGAVTNICSDKTGTLTQGKMVVRKAWVAGCDGTWEVGESKTPLNPTGAMVRWEKGCPKTLGKVPKTRVQREVESPWLNPVVFVDPVNVNANAGANTSGVVTGSMPTTTTKTRGVPLTYESTWTLTGDPTTATAPPSASHSRAQSRRNSVDRLGLMSKSNPNLSTSSGNGVYGHSSPSSPLSSSPYGTQDDLAAAATRRDIAAANAIYNVAPGAMRSRSGGGGGAGGAGGGGGEPYPDPTTVDHLKHFLNIATFCNTAIVAKSRRHGGGDAAGGVVSNDGHGDVGGEKERDVEKGLENPNPNFNANAKGGDDTSANANANDTNGETKWHTRGDPTEVAIQVFTSRFDWNRRKFTHPGVFNDHDHDQEGAKENNGAHAGAVDANGADAHHDVGWKLLAEYPFDSDVKRMSVIYADFSSSSSSTTATSSPPTTTTTATPPSATTTPPSGPSGPTTTTVTTWAFMKGAVERVLDACTSIHVDGQIVPLNPAWRDHVLQNMEVLASQGLRVLAMASRELTGLSSTSSSTSSSGGGASSSTSNGGVGTTSTSTSTSPSGLAGASLSPGGADDWSGYPRSEVEKDMTFHGLVGLYDPPRTETADAVKHCHRAGINVHMLTGDHPETAKAIAAEVGIIPRALETLAPTVKSAMVMTASQFDKLSDAEIDALPVLPLVIARCAPSTKVRMVDALHRRKKFVAMTGDGVNDSPALKRADVGIGMGLAGSDVAKDASDIVLTDDNFASILNAIEEGRRTFDNIKKFVLHLLAENIAQACTLLIGLAFKDRTGLSVFPLAPVEILWIIMITSGFPAMGLGMEEASDDIMVRPPHNVKIGIFTTEILLDMIVYGFYMALLCLTSFSLVVFAFGDGELGLGCNDTYHPSCELVFRARSTTFTCLTWFALILAWEMVHMRRSFFRMEGKPKHPWTMWVRHVWKNQFLFWSIMAGWVTVFPIIYVPGLNRVVFKHGPISWEWGVVFVESGMFIGGIELWKWGKRVWLRKYGEKVRDPQVELGRRMLERYASLATSATQTVGVGGEGEDDNDGDDEGGDENEKVGEKVRVKVGDVRDLEAQK